VSFAGGLPDLQATEARLLANQADIGNAIKPYYGGTLAEAQHRLGGDFAADVRDCDAVHRHILEMADTLSDGIMRQFPKRFR
jgi:hypothetical protein